MRTREFDYYLPPELIAQVPIEPRDASRLLVLHRDTGGMEHTIFREITRYLQPGDVLVANDSRVIPARLLARKVPTGGKAELLLLRRQDDVTWETLVRGRRMPIGTRLAFGEGLQGEIIAITPAGGRLVRFDRPIEALLPCLGLMPLPPYIRVPLAEPERYQTVYARIQGSAAAPTAGLHFTSELIARIQSMGVEFAFITLHIGLDTFKPIAAENIEEHRIHTEYCVVPPETVRAGQQAKAAGKRVIAVGTTTVRALESAARPGSGGWQLEPFSGSTSLYIYPGYQFKVVDAMITNFHLPRSTLLCLVSAFAGKELIDSAYKEAIRLGYRFYSFGDAMLLI